MISVGEWSMRRRTWRMTKPTARPTAIPPTTETKNFQVAWRERERARDHRDDREPVDDERGRVVQQPLALDHRHDARAAGRPVRRSRWRRAGRSERRSRRARTPSARTCPEPRRARPPRRRPPSRTRARSRATRSARNVPAQLADRRVERRRVEQRRQDPDQDDLRVELRVRQPGDQRQQDAARGRAGSDTRCAGRCAPTSDPAAIASRASSTQRVVGTERHCGSLSIGYGRRARASCFASIPATRKAPPSVSWKPTKLRRGAAGCSSAP